MTRPYTVVAGSQRVVMRGARATGPSNPHITLEVTLKVRRKEKLPALNARPAKAMTRGELASRYGAADQDIEAVVKTFAGFGLKPVATSAATRSVRLSGTVQQMEQAFQVKLFDYAFAPGSDELPYRGRVGGVQVPAAVKDIVTGVFGLDNRRVARRRRRHPPVGGGSAHALAAPPTSWYLPAELAQHYNFPPGDGSGQTVAVFEFAGGYFASDLNAFCQQAGVAMPTVQAVSVDGTSTTAHDGTEGETMLDVEVIAGVCPKAKIVAYFAQFTEQGWVAALDALTQDQANDPGVVSISWGSPEDDAQTWTTQAIDHINDAFHEAAMLGITICIAGGDDGSSDGVTDGLAHPDFPSTSPFVLTVGGTTIPQAGGTGPDIVWFEGTGVRDQNFKDGSTGGGVSEHFSRPAWQQDINIKSINPGGFVGRIYPDLAANADWFASPYLLIVNGQSQPNGGTSAASPLVASLFTLINAQRGPGNRVGYVTPVLYQTIGTGATAATVGALGCTDVVTGNNNTAHVGGYSAGPGYDAVSGWGTPNGVNLAAALAQALPPTGGGTPASHGTGS
jgi:kumamolisin